MNDQNTTPPDMIQQAGELLVMLQLGKPIATLNPNADPENDDRAIVIASAILAVAGEIRELRNVLADGLLAELVRTDADNAALIERLHAAEIEVPE